MTRSTSTGTPPSKDDLRARFRAYRRSLSDEAYERRSTAIVNRAAVLPELQTARTVHVYWPLLDSREVDTRPLIARLEAEGIEIVLPVVITFEQQQVPMMNHVRYPGAEMLRKNRWGISEPECGERVEVESIDAVIVPALGAGRNRHRIGQGRGFYDAFLRNVAVPKICLAYEACIVDAVPSEPHDVRMDVVVTEHETVRSDPV